MIGWIKLQNSIEMHESTKPMNDQKIFCQFEEISAANGEIEKKERKNTMTCSTKCIEVHCWWLWQKIAPHYIVFDARHFHGNGRIVLNKTTVTINEWTNKKWNETLKKTQQLRIELTWREMEKKPINYHIKWN